MNKLVSIINKDCKKILEEVDLSEVKGKKVLITGASGLLGTYFLNCLKQKFAKEKKTKIIAIVHSSIPQHLNNIDYFKRVSFANGDITNLNFCKNLPENDFIIHAAGYGQPGRFMEDEVRTLKINTQSVFWLMKKLKKNGKFLFLSTSEIYSGADNPPYSEDQYGVTMPTHHRSCYIEGKRGGEAIVNAFRNKGVEAKSARIALAYGPGTKPNDKRVLNNFVEKGISGKIDLLDQGEAKRTYCYVADAVKILWQIMLKGQKPVYNVGGNSKTTIAKLAKKIGKIMNAEVILPENPNSIKSAPKDVSLSMKRFEKEFGKINYINLDEGLKRTIEWQKQLYK